MIRILLTLCTLCLIWFSVAGQSGQPESHRANRSKAKPESAQAGTDSATRTVNTNLFDSIDSPFVFLAYNARPKHLSNANSTPAQPFPDYFTQTTTPAPAPAADNTAELAKKLSNPVASLISVPFQNNLDCGIGQTGTCRNTLNIQPVIPLSLNDSYNLIIRTIVPVIGQGAFTDSSESKFGLGDVTQSFFFSPKKPVGGMILGFGPVAYFPTATSRFLGTGKWGAGPTFLVLKQNGGWTVGALANHIWSFAGPKSRGDINSTYFQPFVSHTWKNAWTLGFNTESTYDWEHKGWSVPLNLNPSKVTRIGKQLVSIGFGPRVWVVRPNPNTPKWGFRFIFTLLYPKK